VVCGETRCGADDAPHSNGQVKIWNYETQTDLKTFEVTDVPVRCVRYIARKNWVSPSSLYFWSHRQGDLTRVVG
jgi:hypothetical protein